jgi:hypothetical protein
MHECLVEKGRGDLYDSVASVAGSLLGFVTSAVSIILVFGQSLQVLEDSGHYTTIFDVFYQAIIWLAVTTVWSLIGLFMDTGDAVQFWALYGTIGFLLISSLRVFRCVWILKKVTTLAVKQVKS